MKPVPSAFGLPVNWVNYKTGVKQVRFKMDAVAAIAAIGVEIAGDVDIRYRVYGVFCSLKTTFPEGFTWLENTEDEHGKKISRIYKELHDFKIMNENDWPFLISFFKDNIISLDAFWAEHKEIFEMVAGD